MLVKLIGAAIIGWLLWYSDRLYGKLKAAKFELENNRAKYAKTLKSINAELDELRINSMNIERNLKKLGEIGDTLEALIRADEDCRINDPRIAELAKRLKECRDSLC